MGMEPSARSFMHGGVFERDHSYPLDSHGRRGSVDVDPDAAHTRPLVGGQRRDVLHDPHARSPDSHSRL